MKLSIRYLSLVIVLSLALHSEAQPANTDKSTTAPATADKPAQRTVQIPRKSTDTTLKRSAPPTTPKVVVPKSSNTHTVVPQQKIPINKVQPRIKTPTKPRIKPTPVPRSRTKPRSSDN